MSSFMGSWPPLFWAPSSFLFACYLTFSLPLLAHVLGLFLAYALV